MISDSRTVEEYPDSDDTTEEISPAGSAVAVCAVIFFVLGMGAGAVGGVVLLFRSSGAFPLIGIPFLTIGGAIGGAIVGAIVGLFVAPIATIVAKRKRDSDSEATIPTPADAPSPE